LTGRVLLNWLPFTNTSTGAAKRAIELHRRLRGDIPIMAAVTAGFPVERASNVVLKVAAPSRNLSVRLRERRASFWTGLGDFDQWATDTLPIPDFSGRMRTILTVHDLRFMENRRYLSPWRYLLLRLGMGRALSRASAVIAVSRWTAGQLQHLYRVPSRKLHIIPNAAATLPPPDERKPLQEDYILTVGHLEPRKGQACLIRAFAVIAGRWPGKLVITGRGPSKKSLEGLAEELGVSSRVIFAGPVNDFSLSTLYSHCKCLVCPSLYEGFGMTVLEGLAAGAPVVASSIPPHVEAAGDAALWFPPEDHELLADVLREFLDHGGAGDAALGRERAALFSWDRSAELLGGVYRQV
jgi:glycosyltransferase involved in cell wall biosynthesis